MLTDGSYDASGSQNVLGASLEIKAKENDRYYLFFRPSVSYSTESVNTANRSASSSEGTQLNSSEATTSSSSGKIFTNGGIYAGLKELGKKHRSVTLGVEYDFYDIDKTSHEVSLIDAAGVKTGKDLFYGSDIRNFDGGIRLSYSEPLADKWIAAATFLSRYSMKTDIRNASNPDGTLNDYYSSSVYNTYFNEQGSLTVQYGNDTSQVQFGVKIDAAQNIIRSRSMGVENITGKGDWLINWAPFLSYDYVKETFNLQAGYYGTSNQPSSASIMPTLNIADTDNSRKHLSEAIIHARTVYGSEQQQQGDLLFCQHVHGRNDDDPEHSVCKLDGRCGYQIRCAGKCAEAAKSGIHGHIL